MASQVRKLFEIIEKPAPGHDDAVNLINILSFTKNNFFGPTSAMYYKLTRV